MDIKQAPAFEALLDPENLIKPSKMYKTAMKTPVGRQSAQHFLEGPMSSFASSSPGGANASGVCGPSGVRSALLGLFGGDVSYTANVFGRYESVVSKCGVLLHVQVNRDSKLQRKVWILKVWTLFDLVIRIYYRQFFVIVHF